MPKTFPPLNAILFVCLVFVSCSSNNDNAHTTATMYVSPPPHQSLVVVPRPQILPTASVKPTPLDKSVNPTKPFLYFNLEDTRKFRVGEAVPIDFSVTNAKLKGDGGEFRVRYIVDDEEMKWIDKAEPFALQGWVPGEHTILLELIGPDGWPYRNGNANIITRKITVQ